MQLSALVYEITQNRFGATFAEAEVIFFGTDAVGEALG